jgi:amino acid transporter
MNMIGQVTITAGINIGAAIYLIGAGTSILGLPARALYTSWSFRVAVMAAIMVPQVLINIYGIRLIARLNDISVWWHIAGVVAITSSLALFGKHHSDAAFLFSFLPSANPETVLAIGAKTFPSLLLRIVPPLRGLYMTGPPLLLFVLALLQAQWTYTGYDASAHVAEETKIARLNSAWGLFLSVAISAVAGYAMLLVLTWCIPNRDVVGTSADPYPVLYIIARNLPTAIADAIAVIIGGAMWLCGSASVTSMARMWYAFARDDGMPGSALLKRVSGRRRTPVWAIVITSALAVAVCLYAAAFTIVTSISTITLYIAYVIPIALNFRNRLPREMTPWSLGRFAPVVNAIAMAWCLFITVIFLLPPNELVLWTMVALIALMTVYWFVGARRRFAR